MPLSGSDHAARIAYPDLACVGIIGVALCVATTLAIAADDQFVFSNDRSSVRVEVHNMPRGEFLRRLLDGSRTDIKWSDPALAKQAITGNFNGGIADVLRQVLQDVNYAITYSGKNTVAQVIVLGGSDSTTALAPGGPAARRQRIPPPSTPLPPP
jgi:hypothetical protein